MVGQKNLEEKTEAIAAEGHTRDMQNLMAVQEKIQNLAQDNALLRQ